MSDGLDDFMTRLSERLATYVRLPIEPSIWRPPVEYEGSPAWGADDVRRLSDLSIPYLPQRGNAPVTTPDMLLYSLGHLDRLDPSFPDRLTALTSQERHIYLSNASGTGKTRMLFEILAAHWGFYFSCTADAVVDPYGSLDVTTALDRMVTGRVGTPGIYRSVPFRDGVPRDVRWQVVHNRRVAHSCLALVLLARLMIFQKFLAVLSDVSMPESEARLKWLLLQLRPDSYLWTDVFRSLVAYLGALDEVTVAARLAALYADTKSRITFVAIDETNVALNKYPASFATADHRRLAPVFRELVACMASHYPQSRLVISGTELDIDLAREAIRSSVSSFQSITLFHSLGHFATLERTSTYLRHFLGDSASDRLCRTAHTWFRGRHRFLAVFVMYTLKYGPGRAEQVIDTILRLFAQFKRNDSSPLDKIYLGVGFPDKRLEASAVAVHLRHAVLNFLWRRKPTTFTSDAPALVSFGVALYEGHAPNAVFFEPLIYIGLARWLRTSTRSGIHGVIRARLLDESFPIHDASLADGLAACFCNLAATGRPLGSYLDFSGPEPAFTKHPMRLVLPRLSQRRINARFQTRAFPSEACLQVASSPDDVFRWFDDASRPFIIPDADCGPDLMFAVELGDAGRVLVCVHTRPLHATRSRRATKAVPMHPKEFYKQVPAARERFLSYLALFQSRPSPSRGSKVPSKFNTIHLLCFAEPYRSGESYDPPVAVINFGRLTQEAPPTEFILPAAAQSVEESIGMVVHTG
ncbi:hypothetical protein AURDEDRAFT_186239 [Auricularia subglabra TFB-10046 SS5]|nr:hypothetical protein AURDEDRAFT_186239 [Auricularia subglabra TFB-10046 SS5]